MSWTKEENIKQAGIWLARKIGLIEEKYALLVARDTRAKRSGHREPIKQIYRGGIFHAELGTANIGGEKNKTRPVLIMTPNALNKEHTVVVVPLSTKFKLNPNGTPLYSSQYLLRQKDYPQLAADSMLKFEDIRSIDVVRLRDFMFNLDKTEMKKLKIHLLAAMGY